MSSACCSSWWTTDGPQICASKRVGGNDVISSTGLEARESPVLWYRWTLKRSMLGGYLNHWSALGSYLDGGTQYNTQRNSRPQSGPLYYRVQYSGLILGALAHIYMRIPLRLIQPWFFRWVNVRHIYLAYCYRQPAGGPIDRPPVGLGLSLAPSLGRDDTYMYDVDMPAR